MIQDIHPLALPLIVTTDQTAKTGTITAVLKDSNDVILERVESAVGRFDAQTTFSRLNRVRSQIELCLGLLHDEMESELPEDCTLTPSWGHRIISGLIGLGAAFLMFTYLQGVSQLLGVLFLCLVLIVPSICLAVAVGWIVGKIARNENLGMDIMFNGSIILWSVSTFLLFLWVSWLSSFPTVIDGVATTGGLSGLHRFPLVIISGVGVAGVWCAVLSYALFSHHWGVLVEGENDPGVFRYQPVACRVGTDKKSSLQVGLVGVSDLDTQPRRYVLSKVKKSRRIPVERILSEATAPARALSATKAEQRKERALKRLEAGRKKQARQAAEVELRRMEKARQAALVELDQIEQAHKELGS